MRIETYKDWLGIQIEKCANDKDLQREHWAFCKAYGKYVEFENQQDNVIK